MKRRVFLIVLDSYGIGEAPDANQFGDTGCNTLRSITGSKEYDTPLMKKMGLFNIDGVANRVAALCFGPKSVVIVAGMNKVVPNLDAAYHRVRGFSAPANAQRFEINTPCKITGECANCMSEDCICNQFVTTRLCKPAGRIKVILVGEDLGI